MEPSKPTRPPPTMTCPPAPEKKPVDAYAHAANSSRKSTTARPICVRQSVESLLPRTRETFQFYWDLSWGTRPVCRVRMRPTMWQRAASQCRPFQTCDKNPLLTTSLLTIHISNICSSSRPVWDVGLTWSLSKSWEKLNTPMSSLPAWWTSLSSSSSSSRSIRGPVPKLSSACRLRNQPSQHKLLNFHHLLNQLRYSKLKQVHPCKWSRHLPSHQFNPRWAQPQSIHHFLRNKAQSHRHSHIAAGSSSERMSGLPGEELHKPQALSRPKDVRECYVMLNAQQALSFRAPEVPLDTHGFQRRSVMWCELTWCRIQSETFVLQQLFTGSRFRGPEAWASERLCPSLTHTARSPFTGLHTSKNPSYNLLESSLENPFKNPSWNQGAAKKGVIKGVFANANEL